VLLQFKDKIPAEDLRKSMETVGFFDPEVVNFGFTDQGRYFVRSKTQSLLTAKDKAKIKAAVEKSVGKKIILWDASQETGDRIRVRFESAPTVDSIKKGLADVGYAEAGVNFNPGQANPEYDLRFSGVRGAIIAGMTKAYGDKFEKINQLTSVGSAVGKQMRNQGVLSVIYALLGILLYVSFRFDLRYSPGAVLALVHDVSITMGIFCLFGLEFNLPIIAALLAIVGYSLNDTIVVYDRIRESLSLGLGTDLIDNINISVSDCLSRTVLTSVTTFLAVLSIYVFGGGIIQNFALAMLIGVVIGTYSSIYVASPAVVFMDNYLKNRAEDAHAAEKALARARAQS
ncbi:MAG: protein translocase subunit SecF, partial [Myxococcota bacterium]|nr:protein translocase subunit SecF [Myxococcota bacterium]